VADPSFSPPSHARRMPRHTKILLGLIVGLAGGLLVHAFAGGEPWVEWTVRNVAYPVGQLFLRLIVMIVVPLVFSSLVLGVLELGGCTSLDAWG
jgi:dicarboxylate/amino acid:cation (Na+ or H+) symporter, DAACS family